MLCYVARHGRQPRLGRAVPAERQGRAGRPGTAALPSHGVQALPRRALHHQGGREE